MADHTFRLDHRLAENLGYSKKDSFSPSRVSSPLGREEGYRIRIEVIEALGRRFSLFEVACHSLYEQGVSGLLGMTFLENFDFCVFPSKQIMRVV